MQTALSIAALLTVAVGVAHSFLGERYILRRLFRRGNLPQLFGSAQFTERTLRLAWHLTTVAWWGFAALLAILAQRQITASDVGMVVGCTFLIHGAVALVGSRGKHLSWPVFLAIGYVAIHATRAGQL